MTDLTTIDKVLARGLPGDLARIIGQAAQYNNVMRKIALLHAAFIEAVDDAALINAVSEASTIDDHIPYTEADAYSQVIDEVTALIERLANSGRKDLAQQLAAVAIPAGETSAEQIMDGDYWQMSVDDLRKSAKRLGIYPMVTGENE